MKKFFIAYCILIPNNQETFTTFDYPIQELPKQRERRIGHYNIRLLTQLANLFAAEVTISFKIVPLQVVNVYAPVAVGVASQLENLALDACLVYIEQRILRLKERRLVVLVLLALYGITRRDKPLESKPLKVLRKEPGEVAPLWVVARQQHRLVAERIGIVLQIGVHLLLDVGILRVELIVFGSLCCTKVTIIGHILQLIVLVNALIIYFAPNSHRI